MKKLLPFILLHIAFSTSAQEYKICNATSRYYFTNSTSGYHQLFGLSNESAIQSGGDSIYYPFRVLGYNPSLGNCNIIPDFDNWSGNTIITNAAGDHELFTYSSGSFLIKPTTGYLDTFTALTYGNGNTLRAIYSNKNVQTFAGITDSVRTYTLQLFDVNGLPIADNWNGKNIRLSKNNGAVEIPNIRDFPNDTSMLVRTEGKQLTWGDVYSWQTGDVLHENEYSWSTQGPWYISSHTLFNIEVVQRNQVNADSVVFTLARKMNFVQNYPPVNTISYDTIQKSVGKLTQLIFNEMPEQTIDSVRSYSLYRDPLDCGGLRIVYHALNSIFNLGNGCIHYESFEPFFRDSIYIENRGGHFYAEWPHFLNGDAYNGLDPVFTNTTTLTCGIPQYVGMREVVNDDKNFFCVPNPANEYFTLTGISPGETVTVEVFDMSGKRIRSNAVKANERINISDLQNGCYLVRMETAAHVVAQRLIISH